MGGVDCFEKAEGWDVLIPPPNTEVAVVLGVPVEPKLANGEAEAVADEPPNAELEAKKKIVKSKH